MVVTRDITTVSNSISGFVKAFNDLNSNLSSLSAYNATSQKGAVLQGDATVRTLQYQLRNMLSTPVSGAGTFSTLSSIGVTFQKDGTLSLDATKLTKAMSTNFSDIGTLFSSAGGYATKLGTWTSNVLASNGALTSVTNGINQSITDIGKQRTAVQARLVNIQARYTAQYTALDQALSSMNNTQTYLTQQIASMQNLKSN
jgi:flagellar hook-associated protein 2